MKSLLSGVALAALMVAGVHAAEDDPVVAKAAKVIRDCPTCPEIVVVPAGKFVMGTVGPAEEIDQDTGEAMPLNVTIEKPFGLGKTEITTAQYAEFIRESGYAPQPGCRLWNDRWLVDPKGDWRGDGVRKQPKQDFPVTCVSWADAKAYAGWLSKKTGKTYRLPSESEWEYAVRGGGNAARYFGMNSFEGVSISLACDHANVYDVTSQATYPFPVPYARCKDNAADLASVASYKPNAYGLYDMIGNVSEWVEDCYTGSYWGRPADQRAWVWQGGCEQRGLRGGSWASRPSEARSAKRSSSPSDARTTTIGFRVARDLAEGEAK